MLFPLSAASILTTVIVVLVCCYIMAKYRQIFDKIKLPMGVITVLGGLTLYTLGYLPGDAIDLLAVPSAALRALYSTARIFILESDLGDVNERFGSSGIYVLLLNAIHVLGVALTIMTVLSYVGIKFLSRMKLFFAGARQVYLFLGLNEGSENLIKSLKEKGKSRIFIVVENIKDNEEDSNIMKKLREDRFILLDQEWSELAGLSKLSIPKRLFKNEVHVFALSDAENKNVRVIMNLLKQARKDGIADECLHFYIKAQDAQDKGVERILEAINRENGTKYEFKVFNEPDLAARQLFAAHPIHDYLPIDPTKAKAQSGFTIFFAGLGPVGVEALRKSLYLGQFMGGEYRAILADKEMSGIKGQLFNRYPGLKSNYAIECHDAEPGSEGFFDVIANNLETINYIVVALEDDRRSMETAIEIQRLIGRSPRISKPIIAVHIRQHEEFQHLECSLNHPQIHFFGRSTEIFTESIIINESMDRMARRMNALYNSLYHVEPADNWGKLDAFTRESNRAAAMNIATKLRLLGLKMAEKAEMTDASAASKSVGKPVSLKDYLVGERLDNLARQEHLRWNAFHFASGWTTWELKDTGDAKKAKDLLNRRHACLVSWDELEAVTHRFNQSPTYQELDYEQVKNIPMILEAAGYEVYAME